MVILLGTSIRWLPPTSNIDPKYLECHTFSASISPLFSFGFSFCICFRFIYGRCCNCRFRNSILLFFKVVFRLCLVSFEILFPLVYPCAHIASVIVCICIKFLVWRESTFAPEVSNCRLIAITFQQVCIQVVSLTFHSLQISPAST